MAVKRFARCPECDKVITLTRDGFYRSHGKWGGCRASGTVPPEFVEILTEDAAGPTHGNCAHCDGYKRLKQDGAVFRHYDGRIPPYPQMGWCRGSDKAPTGTEGADGAP